VSAKKSGSVKASKQPVQPEIANRPDIFEKMGPRAKWLALGLVFLVAFIVLKDYLLLSKIYQFRDIGSDSLNASWPWMAHSADYISRYGVPSWSFNMGMGQNLLSFSAYDPFDYLLYPFGKEKMIYLIAYKELAKILLTGFFFFRYLRLLSIGNFSATVGALMISFCGYMVVGSGWYLFSFEVLVATLLLYTFELFYQQNKWYWFGVPMFLLGLSRPFNLWPYGLFLFMYVVLRVYQSEEKPELKKMFVLFAKLAGVAVIALGISAPLLLMHLQAMVESPRGSGPDSYSATLKAMPMFKLQGKIELGTDLLRFFSSNMLGGGQNFKGAQNYLEAPLWYCGIPCLLLCGQAFQFLSKRTRRLSIGLLALWLLPVIFPYFRRAFWLFSGDYYRTYSFLVSLLLIFFSVFALDRILAERRVNMKMLLFSLLGLLVILNIPYFPDKTVVDGGMRLFALVALLFYAGMIYMIGRKSDVLSYKYALLGFFLVELIFFSWSTVNKRSVVTAKDLAIKTGYNDYSVEAIAFIKKSDPSFYRIDKIYFSSPAMHGSLNDGMVQDYYGTSSYNPFNQLHYINYLKTMGVINKVNELESRWSPGLANRFILESLNSVKYVLSKSGYAQPIWRVSHDSLAQFGDVLVLRNKFALPFGYGYSRYVKLSDFEKLPLGQKDFVSTVACVVNDEDVPKVGALKAYDLKDTLPQNQFTIEVLKANTDSLKRSALTITDFRPTAIRAGVTLPAQQVVYTSLPYDKGWLVTDNGKPVDKLMLSNGMTGLLLAGGPHELEFGYGALNFERGIIVSLGCLLLYGIAVFVGVRYVKKKRFQHAG
jgi:uncharacterized membrane protein YfhO